MNPEPFRIEPTFSPRIWGARSLAPLFPEKTNLAEAIGEAWLTDVNCRVATGPFTGKTLGEAWREMPAEWRGSRFAEAGDFPLLVKFIFPTDKLSIQVHPDDAYASVHEKAAGGRGKTEMWHAVSAEPGAQILVGLKPGVTKEGFLEALANKTLEDCFVRHNVHAGDTFFIPAGTPHTIGPGMVLCEVQQYSDLTYRVDDYSRVDAQGKPRELHLDKALHVISFDATPIVKVQPKPLKSPFEGIQRLVTCPYFDVFRQELMGRMHFKMFSPSRGAGHFQLMVVLEGEVTLSWLDVMRKSGKADLRGGECWFVPGNAFESVSYDAKNRAALLSATVPNLEEAAMM